MMMMMMNDVQVVLRFNEFSELAVNYIFWVLILCEYTF